MKSTSPKYPEEFLRLLSELTDGSLNSQDLDMLREILSRDPVLLDLYCMWMYLHASLSLDFHYSPNLSTVPPLSPDKQQFLNIPQQGQPKPRKQNRTNNVLAALLAAAACIAIAFFLWPMNRPHLMEPVPGLSHRSAAVSDRRGEFERTSVDSVAVLARVAGAVGSDSAPLVVGSPIPSGTFEINSGLVQLEFLSGANIVVEGPAKLDLKSTMLVECHRGKLRVRVPEQAQGFSVDTPSHRAIDLGTEFAVSVNEEAATEVHVFEGEVKLCDLASLDSNNESLLPQRLTIGSGYRAPRVGRGERIAANPDQFVDAQRLLQLSSQNRQNQFNSWSDFSSRWSRDPHVIAYYNFQESDKSSRVLRQVGPTSLGVSDGAIVGCHWTEGRWLGKSSLEFKGVEDRVRLSIPGSYRSMTLACWMRIDGFDRRLGSIFLTDGHDIGECHWQFTDLGELLLGVKADQLQSQEYLTGTVLKATDLGRWIHLACVYDDDLRQVVHYVDGVRVASFSILKRVPLRFGAAELGNWVPQDLRENRIRNLNGRIDEFLLLNRGMTDDEVVELYMSGRPNS